MCALVALAVDSQATFAQSTSGWMDLGGATVQQPRSSGRAAGTVGAGVMQRGRRFALTADGAVTIARDSLATTQAFAGGRFALAAWAVTEIEASATSIGITMPGANGNRSLLFRQQVQLGSLRLFASAGAGNTSRNQLNSHSTAQQLGATATRRIFGDAFSLTTTVQRATTDDWQLMEAADFSLRSAAEWYGMHDATAELLWQFGGVAISASKTWRAGFGATHGTGNGYAIASLWPLRGPFTFAAQAGRQLADPLRGVPQASYMAMSMRVQLGRAPNARVYATRIQGAANLVSSDRGVFEPIAGAEYRLERRDGGAELVLRVSAASDAMVEVAHSANEWAPLRLTRDGDAFVARITLASGTHRVALRVNGGAWRAPRGLSRVNDDFGGSAGLLVVP